MIVLLHVATGGALGALTRSRMAALALGPPLHLACDWVPHEDIRTRRFEVRSGLFGLALLALCRGPLDPATLGAASASAPDLEHVFPRLRPRGRKLFHGRRGWHRAGGFRADVQLVLAGAIIGLLVKPPRQAWQTQCGGSEGAFAHSSWRQFLHLRVSLASSPRQRPVVGQATARGDQGSSLLTSPHP